MSLNFALTDKILGFLKKGSAEAREKMAALRAMKGNSKPSGGSFKVPSGGSFKVSGGNINSSDILGVSSPFPVLNLSQGVKGRGFLP